MAGSSLPPAGAAAPPARAALLRARAALPPGPLAVVASAVLAVWMTVDVLRAGWWASVDASLSDLVRDIGIRETFWPKVGVYAFTQFGARGTIVTLFVPFVAAVAWRRRTWQPVLRFVVALAVLTVVVYALKYGVARTAPPVDRTHAPTGQSYPSGHAPNAVLMWGLMAWLAAEYDLPERVRRLLGLMRYAAPAFTTLSMLLLDYHWLTDLAAGLAIGVILLRVLHLVFDGRLGQWGHVGGTADRRGDGAAGTAPGAAAGLAAPGTADVVR